MRNYFYFQNSRKIKPVLMSSSSLSKFKQFQRPTRYENMLRRIFLASFNAFWVVAKWSRYLHRRNLCLSWSIFRLSSNPTGSKKFPSTLASRDGISRHSAKQTRRERRAGTGSLPASSRFSWPGRRRWCPRWSRRLRTGRECPLWSARSGKKIFFVSRLK